MSAVAHHECSTLQFGIGNDNGNAHDLALCFGAEQSAAHVVPCVCLAALVSSHPAVQGWYICDDCCKGYDFSRNLSHAYKLLRRFDPYHVTTGAAECNELQAFQEPFLSLDFPMVRNC